MHRIVGIRLWDLIKKLFDKLRKIEKRLTPKFLQDWYDGLDYWPRNLVNWFGVHGGFTVLAVVAGKLIWGTPWYGYAAGAGFYIVKETVTWLYGGSKWPSLDQTGDALGPVIMGGIAVIILL